jgi:serine/threonine protein kinase
VIVITEETFGIMMNGNGGPNSARADSGEPQHHQPPLPPREQAIDGSAAASPVVSLMDVDSTTSNNNSNGANAKKRRQSDGGGITNSHAGGMSSMTNTPHTTAGEINPAKATAYNKNNAQQQQLPSHPNFGGPIYCSTSANFPAIGSTLGPYFCVGRLGKGTFCSIHRCINLHYFHSNKTEQPQKQPKQDSTPSFTTNNQHRLAAAKLEIGEFKNSGVLGGEATMLQFLDMALDKNTVPVYMGHYRGNDDVAAIVMEYLPGQDMHQIRDWATRSNNSNSTTTRRISISDAVYLTATVMLPLLERMHQVGIVHRDVKPSNCVKRGVQGKDFAMVDFGLSKSIIVPKDSPHADADHPWTNANAGTDAGGELDNANNANKNWIRPPNYKGQGHFRKERPTADFRGTSMYASVRVHQLKDYSPRDDMWSLMYVFCDLVSGGLPWMSYAANRDRDTCRILKERIHGEQEGIPEQTELLLMGHEYHVALFKKNRGALDPPPREEEKGGSSSAWPLPPPLAMSKDKAKVQLLRNAFEHLGKLAFCDTPNYKLIRECLEGFLEGEVQDKVAPIAWERLSELSRRKSNPPPLLGADVPIWEFMVDHADPLVSEPDIFSQAEAAAAGEPEEKLPLSGDEADLRRLPLELRFRMAQMEYNTLHHATIAPHLALRDWLKAALPVLYGEWETRKFEKGGHRTDKDGYRREVYLKIIEKCLKCARKFNQFRDLGCIYETDNNVDAAEATGTSGPKKRRKVMSTMHQPKYKAAGSELITISKVLFELRAVKRVEGKKSFPPPPPLAFR